MVECKWWDSDSQCRQQSVDGRAQAIGVDNGVSVQVLL